MKKRNNKLIFLIFTILLLAAMIPFNFTETPYPILFGWLPATLLYWWGLMGVNLIFVLWVAKAFVNDDKEEDKHEDESSSH